MKLGSADEQVIELEQIFLLHHSIEIAFQSWNVNVPEINWTVFWINHLSYVTELLTLSLRSECTLLETIIHRICESRADWFSIFVIRCSFSRHSPGNLNLRRCLARLIWGAAGSSTWLPTKQISRTDWTWAVSFSTSGLKNNYCLMFKDYYIAKLLKITSIICPFRLLSGNPRAQSLAGKFCRAETNLVNPWHWRLKILALLCCIARLEVYIISEK